MEAKLGFKMVKVQSIVFGKEIKAGERPLVKVTEAFRDLAASIDHDSDDGEAPPMSVASFAHACALINVLVGSLGFAFRIAEHDLDSKVRKLAKASKTISTLPELIDEDIKMNTVKDTGSDARNILRLNRGFEFLKVLFEEMLATEGDSMESAATKAYNQVFGSYHSPATQNIVMYTVLTATPTRSELRARIHEHDHSSTKIQMKGYVAASEKVIQYINGLFDSREVGIDW